MTLKNSAPRPRRGGPMTLKNRWSLRAENLSRRWSLHAENRQSRDGVACSHRRHADQTLPVKLVAVAVAINDHVNDHVIGRQRKPHLNQKGNAGAFGARSYNVTSSASQRSTPASSKEGTPDRA